MTDADPLRISANDYGASYRADLLVQYQDYVASADRISDRRDRANTFFMGGNTTLLTVTGYLTGASAEHYLWLPALAGIAFSVTWRVLIGSYRSLNTAKFAVIHDIEQQLPLAPYDAEWAHIQARGNYRPFSVVESWVPIAFVGLHGIVACLNLYPLVVSWLEKV